VKVEVISYKTQSQAINQVSNPGAPAATTTNPGQPGSIPGSQATAQTLSIPAVTLPASVLTNTTNTVTKNQGEDQLIN
jgi:hypothetical protein